MLVLVLLFGNQICQLSSPQFRLNMRVDRAYRTALALDILSLAVLAVAIDSALLATRARGAHRAYRHLYLAAFGSGALTVTPWVCDRPAVFLALWFPMMGGILALLLAPAWDRLRGRITAMTLILWPLTPILLIQLFSWNGVIEPPAIGQGPGRAAAGARPVVILLCDEWSYSRSVAGGEFLPELANLRALAGRSFVFGRARSESASTAISVPQTLFGTRRTMDYGDGRPRFAGDAVGTRSWQSPSVFTAAREHGYTSTLIGWELPYRDIFGDQVDTYRCTPSHDWPRGEGLPGNMARAVVLNVHFSLDPIARLLRRAVVVQEQRLRTDEILASTVRQVREGPRNMFLFAHWPIPHGPLLFGPDGTRDYLYDDASPRDYMGQLRYADRAIGLLLDQLRLAGKFDDALIVFLSDHGWRDDGDPISLADPDRLYRVPLVVKWPGQTSMHVVDRPVSTSRLGTLIEAALRGADEGEASRIIESISQ